MGHAGTGANSIVTCRDSTVAGDQPAKSPLNNLGSDNPACEAILKWAGILINRSHNVLLKLLDDFLSARELSCGQIGDEVSFVCRGRAKTIEVPTSTLYGAPYGRPRQEGTRTLPLTQTHLN